MLPHLLLSGKAQLVQYYAFLQYSVHIQENLSTRKTPLLRSMDALSNEALRVVKLFDPETKATRVTASVGPEQEYFLVSKDSYEARKDLKYTGRTLFGAPAPKGQELEDQYFGAIKENVGAYMKDLNRELWKLGITATDTA